MYILAVADAGFFTTVGILITRFSGWFIRGSLITLFLAVTGTVAGFIIGLLVAVVRNIPLGKKKSFRFVMLKIVRFILTAYVEFFRGTPMMVQAMVIYFGLMQAFQINLNIIFAGFIIVTINTGAYLAEISRGGIESIDKGQFEAAHSIGMTHWKTMYHIILPQAVRNILPALGNEFVINIKDTSVLSVIAVTDLFYFTKSVQGQGYKYFETFFCYMLYLFYNDIFGNTNIAANRKENRRT